MGEFVCADCDEGFVAVDRLPDGGCPYCFSASVYALDDGGGSEEDDSEQDRKAALTAAAAAKERSVMRNGWSAPRMASTDDGGAREKRREPVAAPGPTYSAVARRDPASAGKDGANVSSLMGLSLESVMEQWNHLFRGDCALCLNSEPIMKDYSALEALINQLTKLKVDADERMKRRNHDPTRALPLCAQMQRRTPTGRESGFSKRVPRSYALKVDVGTETDKQPEPAPQPKAENTCVVCLEKPLTHMVVPCNHVCFCQDCHIQVLATQGCPVCREKTTKVVRVYLSAP